MSYTIKKVEYLEEYKLKLKFNDGAIKIVDLEKMLKKAKNMLLPLKDTTYFKQVKCDGVSICWPNGVDLCPDMLYNIGKSITMPTPKRSRSSIAKTAQKRAKTHRKQ